MLLSTELKRQKAEYTAQMKSYMDSKETEKAYDVMKELKGLDKKIEMQELIEQAEMADHAQAVGASQAEEATNQTGDARKAFHALVRGKAVNEADLKAYLNDVGQKEGDNAKGGYLVPSADATKIVEFKRDLVQLEGLCRTVTVNTKSGTMPVESTRAGKLVNFSEFTEITQKDYSFTQLAWNVSDYGLLVPISNTFLDDEACDFLDYVNRDFAQASVRTRNEQILAKAKTNAEVINATKGIPDILTALNMIDPAMWATSTIVTNQTGWQWLDNLTSETGENLLQPVLGDPTAFTIRGRRVYVVSDAELAPDSGTKAPFYIGDLSSCITVFDRKQMAVELSKEAGFTKNISFLRAIERFDVAAIDKKALKCVTVDTAKIPAAKA